MDKSKFQFCRCPIAGLPAFLLFLLFLPDSSAQSPAQEIRNDDGSMFMEEVPEQRKQPKNTKQRPRIDFESLGVPVDGKGRIVPLIQRESGPVLRNSSRFEIEYTPPAVYVPYFNYRPYAYTPVYTPHGGYSYGWAQPWFYPQYQGALALPLGIPRYYTSSSDDPNPVDFNSSEKYWQALPSASVWSPSWRSPWGSRLWLPGTVERQQEGSIRSFFPNELSR